MGSNAKVPSSGPPSEDADDGETNLGDLLSGRLSGVDVDSVEAVREVRERE
jgi:hypothetical protein